MSRLLKKTATQATGDATTSRPMVPLHGPLAIATSLSCYKEISTYHSLQSEQRLLTLKKLLEALGS